MGKGNPEISVKEGIPDVTIGRPWFLSCWSCSDWFYLWMQVFSTFTKLILVPKVWALRKCKNMQLKAISERFNLNHQTNTSCNVLLQLSQIPLTTKKASYKLSSPSLHYNLHFQSRTPCYFKKADEKVPCDQVI